MPVIRSASHALLFWMLVSGAAKAADPPTPTETSEAPRAPHAPQPLDAAPQASALAATPSPESTGLRLQVPAGTELVFEMVDSLSSKTSQRGDRFSLKLAEPLLLDGRLLIPAGTLARGDVMHADRARAGGQAGELILAARYLEWDGRKLPLKSLRAGVGRSRTDAAMGVMVAAGVAGFLVRGGQMEVPAGSPITATLREAVELYVPPAPVAEETAAPAATATPETTTLDDTTPGETTE